MFRCQQGQFRAAETATASLTNLEPFIEDAGMTLRQALEVFRTEASRMERLVLCSSLHEWDEEFDKEHLYQLCLVCGHALYRLELHVWAEKFYRLRLFLHEEDKDDSLWYPEIAGVVARSIARCLHSQGKYTESLHHLHAARAVYKDLMDTFKKGRKHYVASQRSTELDDEYDLSSTKADEFCKTTIDGFSSKLSVIEDDFRYHLLRVYENHGFPKGFALIINNYEFKPVPRHGTDEDEREMQLMLKALGYTVESYGDLTAKQMLRAAEKFAAKDHRFSQSCIVVVLTHGHLNTLLGTDGSLVNIGKFIRYFEAAPSLVGKPKIFIFQACRGSRHEYGTPLEVSDGFTSWLSNILPSRAVSINQQTRHIEKIPETADVLVAYAAPTDYVSLRNVTTGSWFTQTICKVFPTYAAEEHILELLTRVNNEVATKETERGEKQMPSCVLRLRKKFYFMPGIFREVFKYCIYYCM